MSAALSAIADSRLRSSMHLSSISRCALAVVLLLGSAMAAAAGAPPAVAAIPEPPELAVGNRTAITESETAQQKRSSVRPSPTRPR